MRASTVKFILLFVAQLLLWNYLNFSQYVFIVFLPLQDLLGIGGGWLLVMLGLVFLIERSGWLSSAYISAETRFVANYNERNLQRGELGEGNEWLDEKLFVEELEIRAEQSGKSLRLSQRWDCGIPRR